MKSIMKFGSMKSETIAKGIMICIALILLYRLTPFVSFLIPDGTEVTPTISVILNIRFYLVMFGSLIIELVLLRLFCEVIYNLVSAAKYIISDKEKHDQNLQG